MSSTEKVLLTEGSLEDIADAIREKNGTENEYKPREMAPAIRALNTETEWGEIGGTLSDQTDLQNALDSLNADLANKADDSVVVKSVNGKTPTSGAVTVIAEDIPADGIGDKSVSGNPIIVNDAMASVAKSLSVDLEPIQDLHGYGHPWVGGAGKNLCEVTATTTVLTNGVTLTVNDDGSCKINGTASSNLTAYLNGALALKAGSYIATDGGSGSSSTAFMYLIDSGETTIATVSSGSASFTLAEDATIKVALRMLNGKTYTNMMFYPMIRLSSETDATFAPYTNICPIYPHTQAEVQRTKKNLLPMTVNGIKAVNPSLAWSGNSTTVNGVTFTIQTDNAGNVIGISANGTATNAAYIGVSNGFVGDEELYSWIAQSGNYRLTSGVTGDSGTTYGVFYRTSDNVTQIVVRNGVTVDNLLFKPMVRLASVQDDTWEPYQGQTATVTLPQTVYGGDVDFSGKCLITHATQTFDGTESWNKHNPIYYPYTNAFYLNYSGGQKQIDNYNVKFNMFNGGSTTISGNGFVGPNTVQVSNKNWETAEDLKAYFASNPLQVVYELETPIELDLTPAQLTLLEGTNILTADGTINLTYLGSMASNVQDEIDEFESGLNNVIGSITFIENSTAKTSHAVGEYVILNGIFCKVIAAVSSGETLSFGTNIQATTIGAELRAIWAEISA